MYIGSIPQYDGLFLGGIPFSLYDPAIPNINDLESLLTSLLRTVASASGRVYCHPMPELCPMPAITYSVIASTPLNSLDGTGGTEESRVQIDVWAQTFGEAHNAMKEVKSKLQAAQKQVPNLLQNRFSQYDNESLLHHVVMDYWMVYTND